MMQGQANKHRKKGLWKARQDTPPGCWPFPRRGVVKRAWEVNTQTASASEMPPSRSSRMRTSPAT